LETQNLILPTGTTQIVDEPGYHEVWVGYTKIYYYVPRRRLPPVRGRFEPHRPDFQSDRRMADWRDREPGIGPDWRGREPGIEPDWRHDRPRAEFDDGLFCPESGENGSPGLGELEQPSLRRPRELFFLIHGSGRQFASARNYIVSDSPNFHDWRDFADRYNVILVAPAFEMIYYSYPAYDTWEEAADFYEKVLKLGVFPMGYKPPDRYLHEYQRLLSTKSQIYPVTRADGRLNEIFFRFRSAFPDVDQERFNIYGYSGGGQFVSRYMMVHPERLKRIALGGAGAYLFPSFEFNYPHGLRCRYEDSAWIRIWGHDYTDPDSPILWGLNSYFRPDNLPEDWAHWLVSISVDEWKQRIATLLDRQIFVFAGVDDFLGCEPSIEDPRLSLMVDEYMDRCWQGDGQLERALNFQAEMLHVDRLLKARSAPGDDFRAWTSGLLEAPDRFARLDDQATAKKRYREADAPFEVFVVPLWGDNHKTGAWHVQQWMLDHNWWHYPRKLRYDAINCVRPEYYKHHTNPNEPET
jgi:pimeloyl-ACP methyl ester carboxylesterase